MRILRQRALAEDALQDVFVQVWNRAGQYEPGRGSAWALADRDRALPGDRPAAARGALPCRDRAWTSTRYLTDSDSTEASELGLGERASRALAHCMGALQPRQRECIALAFQGGLTHPEVAAEIGEPLGSVKSWIRRGLAALKRCLES